jgi:hypothetical protein
VDGYKIGASALLMKTAFKSMGCRLLAMSGLRQGGRPPILPFLISKIFQPMAERSSFRQGMPTAAAAKLKTMARDGAGVRSLHRPGPWTPAFPAGVTGLRIFVD